MAQIQSSRLLSAVLVVSNHSLQSGLCATLSLHFFRLRNFPNHRVLMSLFLFICQMLLVFNISLCLTAGHLPRLGFYHTVEVEIDQLLIRRQQLITSTCVDEHKSV